MAQCLSPRLKGGEKMKVISVLGLIVLLSACTAGGGNYSGPPGGGSNPPNVQGMWAFSAVSSKGFGSNVVYTNLTQSGSTFSASSANTVDCFVNVQSLSSIDVIDDCNGGGGAFANNGGTSGSINGTVDSGGEVQAPLL